MNPISAQKIADILGVPIAAGRGDVVVSGGVSTDTRKLPQGSAFFALRGENFNGDRFAPQALAGGSAVAIVQQWDGEVPANTAVIVVSDTLLALQRLAHWWRKQLDLPVVGITGSNGKTSTKDFTAAVLSKRYNVSATRGNLNNHIGVPLTVLATTPEHTAAVWEMGMNHSGEIAPLCEIARPKYGIITNIGTAHIEFMGTREAIAEEKGMLARALPADGILFIPATCEFLDYLRKRNRGAMVAVGNGRGLVRAEDLNFGLDGSTFTLVIEGAEPARVTLTVPGRHMVTNALLAAAVGWKLGIPSADIAAGLSEAVLTGGRLGRYDYHGTTVIDDTYNANPESMAAAIETLAETPVTNGARRFIVLGRMGELGAHAPVAHLRTGALAAERGLTVIAVGDGSEGIAAGANDAPHFPDLDQAAKWLTGEVKPGDIVLFKGSRTATVERVMHAAFPPKLMLPAIYDFWHNAFEHGESWAKTFRFLNLFQYITFRAASAGLLAFILSVIFGPRVIRRLISLKVGQPIRTAEEVHKLAELHGGKLGTPTMGGVLIIGSVLISTLIFARPLNPFIAVCACTMAACGLLGFCDDYKKVREKKSDGISSRRKMGWQILIALVAASFLYFKKEISGFGATHQQIADGLAGYRLGEDPIGIGAITFPLFKEAIVDLQWMIIPFFALVIVGCSNAVNLTDGLDGLATGTTISVALSYAFLTYLAGHYYMATEYLVIPHNRYIGELAIFLMALVGACFGFLWFNCHPAKVFMGDTGSLAIGGALGTAAICAKQELLLIIIGGVFVMEAMSVILQVGSFKMRKKRIFKMSPIHHHFELLGWHENQVIIRFWIISIMLALFGLALLKIA